MGQLKHGLSPRGKPVHRLYSTWAGMIQRCHYPKAASWKWYGAKGIKVCDRWREFKNFLEDMGPTWKPHLTLERLDNSKDYEPGNVVWETTTHQRETDSHGRIIEFKGVSQRISKWAQQIGITDVVLRLRLRKGWSIEKALTTPSIQNRNPCH